jgi:aromatic-L-amino-acid decarboxylase
MLVNFDCSTMWFKNNEHIVEAFNVDPLYLKHAHQDKILDYRHLGIPLGRRFRSLKLWFVMRLYGLDGLQKHIRKHVCLAKEFEQMLRSDPRFEITNDVILGLVCFRVKGTNEQNKELLRSINEDGRIHMVPSESRGVYFLRFAVCATRTESSDIQYAWHVIMELTNKLVPRPSQIDSNYH